MATLTVLKSPAAERALKAEDGWRMIGRRSAPWRSPPAPHEHSMTDADAR